MSKSVADVKREQIEKYGTENNTYDDFPVGSHIKIITPHQDFSFFYEETGTVIRNDKSYLGIIVEFDEPREYENGHIQTKFNFNPKDLFLLERGNGISRFDLMDLENE